VSKHAPNHRWRVSHRLRCVVVAGAITAGLAAVPVAAPPAEAFASINGVRLNAVEARLVTLINRARTSRGIAAVRVAPGFTDVARRWSATMASRRSMYHNPRLVSQVSASGGSDWRAVAENVGYGYSADSLFDMYMRSSGHRANILNSRMRYVGIGWAERPGGLGYNTQVFVSAYSTRYGRVRVPAFGGRDDGGTPTSDWAAASFERWDSRVARAPARGMSVAIRQTSGTASDDALRMRVRETVDGSTGAAGVAVRTSVNLRRVRSATVKLRAYTPTRRPVRVDLYARAMFGGSDVRVGSVYLHHGRAVRVRLTLPSAARVWRNELRAVVSRASLNGVSSRLAARYADIDVFSITMNV
jgi:uncharacterized protein YkwD